MHSSLTHFRVYLIAMAKKTGHDQYALYVDHDEGEWGVAYQVVGNLETEHMFMCIPVIPHPKEFASLSSMRHVGWVAHEGLELLEGRLQNISPPSAQASEGNLIVPLEHVRTSETWANEAIDMLQGEGYIAEIGFRERICRAIRRLRRSTNKGAYGCLC